MKLCISLLLGLAAFSTPIVAQPIAFPGAEGHGRFATGGRGGVVYAVTNLNDSGPGSLREAVEASGPRTVVFRVSGTIHLERELGIRNGDITIAGQTAPGDGITLAGHTLKVDGKNIIVRFIRSRLGDETRQEKDAFEARYAENVIIDHCTFSWAIDETATAYNNKNFTMQWCIISEGLHNSYHSKGNHGYGGIWGGKNATFHHNLIAHSRSRMPRFNGARYADYAEWGDDQVDFRNNVIYNWGDNSVYGAEPNNDGFRPRYNIVGNVYKPGPGTQSSKLDRIINPDDNSYGVFAEFFLADNYVFGADTTSRDNVRGVDGVSAPQWATMEAADPFVMGRLVPDWQLLRFNRDTNGDGALDIFENYTEVEIDPLFRLDRLDRFDIRGPALVLAALRNARVDWVADLPPATLDVLRTYLGYYEAAGAVYADGSPFIAAEYDVVAPFSELALSLQFQPIPAVETFPALEAYEQVLAHAGASFPFRDSVDHRVINEVRTGTAPHGNNGHIDSPDDVGGYPVLESTEAPLDTDGDGIPDAWELAHGLDPNDPADGNFVNEDGYTNLEHYLNSLVADHFPSAYSATYAEWAAAVHWDDATVRAPGADPDADGLSNVLEYALVSDPRRVDAPAAVLPNLHGPGLYRFTHRLGTDLELRVQTSSDLDVWTTAWSSQDPSTAAVPVRTTTAFHTAEVELDFRPSGDPTAPAGLFWQFEVVEDASAEE